MATELQFNIFRSLYDEELQRANDLRNSGKIYLGACTFLVGGLLLKYSDLTASINGEFGAAVIYAACFFLIAATVLVLWSLGIFRYEYFADPINIIKGFSEAPPDDKEFLDARIVDLAVAFDRNRGENDKRAQLLNIASLLLITGAILIFIVFVMAI